MLNYILGFNEVALENGAEAITLLPNLLATPHPPIITFYYALSLAKAANNSNVDRKPTKLIKQIKQQLKKQLPNTQGHQESLLRL